MKNTSSLNISLYLIGVICTSLLLHSPVFAQNQRNETNLGDILVRFCNDEEANAKGGTKTLELDTDAGQETEICMYISNTGPDDTNVLINFVDGTITNDAEQQKACQPEGTKSNFGQYVKITEPTYFIEAGKTLQTSAAVTFPLGTAGMKYGCVTSQIVGKNESDTGMFKVVSRRANFIDVLVNGDIISLLDIVPVKNTTENISQSNEILITQDPFTKEYFAKIVVENKGNVAQQVQLTPTITSRFQTPKQGETISQKVLPGARTTLQFKLDEYIPFRKGNVNIDIEFSHKAIIDFESEAITPAHKQLITKQLTTSFFLIPWAIIIAILILLVILRIISNRRKPKHDTEITKEKVKDKEKKKTTKKTKNKPTSK